MRWLVIVAAVVVADWVWAALRARGEEARRRL